jgi:hypothetical protein
MARSGYPAKQTTDVTELQDRTVAMELGDDPVHKAA